MFRKVSLNLLSRSLNEASQIVVRTDFNVPLRDGKILDLARVKGTPSLMQPPSPLLSTSSPTTPSPSCCSLTWEDPMDSPAPNTPLDLWWNPCNNCLANL